MSCLPRVLLLLLVLGMPGLAGAAPAQPVYKWTDQDGVMHYSDQPPPESAKAERVDLRVGSARAVPDPQVEEPAPDDALRSPQSVKACEAARRNITVLEGNTRVQMDLDGDGTPEELTAEQRERELERARGLVVLLCPDEPEV